MSAASIDAAPVLIVGAGPTGLAAAMSLARSGIPVRLIDKARTPDPRSRAIGLQARTLELLEQHRVIAPFLEHGHRARAANVWSNGQRLARLDFDPMQTRYPYLLFIEQSITERILGEHLARLGVAIERGTEWLQFSQSAAGLSVTLRRADGHIETMRPSYLVAADGAQSAVRNRLDLPFVGKSFAQTVLLADLLAEGDFPDDEFQLFASGDGIVGLFPLGAGRYRMIADHPSAAGGAASGATGTALTAVASLGEPPALRAAAAPAAPTLDDCRALIARRVHQPVRIGDLGWSAYFDVHRRMVERVRVERVFLAGDAAHVHSPAGSQGLNLGIQEAFNLGWKIACVLGSRAPERLLDTYHAERHPIERDVLRQSSFIAQLAEADHGPLKLLRDRVMPVLATLGPLRDAARMAISELSIHYRRSPLTFERVLDGGPRAGERAPDARVHVVDGPLGRVPGSGCIFDLHDPAAFSLFLLVPTDEPGKLAFAAAGDRRIPTHAADMDRLAQAITALMPEAVRVWRISDPDGGDVASLTDAYGRTRPAFYLVRPDGYIAARGRPGSDFNGLVRHCEAWFASAPAAPETTTPGA